MTDTVSKPITVPGFMAAKSQNRKLVMVTAYDWLWAGIAEEAGVDAILVGDSMAMVVQGHSTTLPVTMRQMEYHATLVCRAVKRALVIVDLPFLSYQVSPRQAIRNAGRLLKRTGAAAVKLEGGVAQAETIRALVAAEIPVMAHVGLRPQAVHMLGGHGKLQRNGEQLLADALAAQQAGAFGVVLEMVPQLLAARLTQELRIPTIGIGAGPHCDGQVLVGPDLLGLTPGFRPKFLKQFGQLRDAALSAIRDYGSEVRDGSYPGPEHSRD
jgi:3-methyl-2-oxobutanoate hydroxymethyltransferase